MRRSIACSAGALSVAFVRDDRSVMALRVPASDSIVAFWKNKVQGQVTGTPLGYAPSPKRLEQMQEPGLLLGSNQSLKAAAFLNVAGTTTLRAACTLCSSLKQAY
jgi:hypothetical protein